MGKDDDILMKTEESNDLMCKNFTSSSGWGGMRKRPYALTESGIYMLMTVLDTKVLDTEYNIVLIKQKL